MTFADRVAITLDVDWAPDFAIDHAAALLAEHEVAATWFITHASPAVERLREHPELFELGIHPNFAAGSTHGPTPDAVLDHMLALVPEARAMRTHGLLQSSALLARVRERTPIEVDVSLFLPHAEGLAPVEYPLESGTLVRVPYLWEDDAEMLRPAPAWDAAGVAAHVEGLAVFAFHPIHVYLNAPSLTVYRALKRGGYPDVSREMADALRADGAGPGSAFTGLIAALAGARGRRVSELA